MVTDCRYLSSNLCCTPQTYLDQDAFFKSITWDLCSKEPTLGNVPLLGRDEVWVWGKGSHCFLSLNAHSDAMAVLHEPQKEEQQKASTWQLLPASPFEKKKV